MRKMQRQSLVTDSMQIMMIYNQRRVIEVYIEGGRRTQQVTVRYLKSSQ